MSLEHCPKCNYPGVVTCGKEKGCGPYFGIYEKDTGCGYCGYLDVRAMISSALRKLFPPPKVKLEETVEYQEALARAKIGTP